jgi:hypothetical protein
MVGFASTPTTQDLSTIALEVNPLFFKGATIFAFLPTTERSLVVENLFAEDKFMLVAGTMLDDIRVTFANSIVRKLDDSFPQFVQFFGQVHLFDLLSFRKGEIKVVITIFGLMISDDFSNSDMLKDFWFLITKWLIFSRFTESLVALITTMIQFPGGQHLIISNTGLEELKQLVHSIAPIPSTADPRIKISSNRQTQIFVQNMRQSVCDLKQFAGAFSGHVRSSSKFDKHIKAIEFSLHSMEYKLSPQNTAKKMKLFQDERLFELLGSSRSKTDITKMVCCMLGKNPKHSHLADFFQYGRGTIFLEKIFDFRIAFLRKQKEEMEAQNRLFEVTILNQQLKRRLMRQKAKTDQLVEVLSAPSRHDSELSSKRPRQQQFSDEVQPHKRSVHLPAGLVDLRDVLGSRQ